jgi:hypothetical protein
MVDGYAVVAADLATGRASLRLLEEVTAGEVPRQSVVSGAATRIMTGAPIPHGADAVVMVERSSIAPDGRIVLDDARLVAGQNIFRRGRSLVRGQVVLHAGARLRSIEIGVLAEVGRAEVQVICRLTVAVSLRATNPSRPPRCPVPPDSQQQRPTSSPPRESGAANRSRIARDDAGDLARLTRWALSPTCSCSPAASGWRARLVPGVLKSPASPKSFTK